MPVTTRSKGSERQTQLDDFDTKNGSRAKPRNPKPTRPATPPTKKESDPRSKRKSKQSEVEARPIKKQKQKQTSIKPDEDLPPEENSKPVIINRAPVLQLWAACVSQALYPALPWSTHLSIGSAISTLCAISKGRAIGTMDKPSDDNPTERAKKERKKRAAEESADDEVNVMRFRLLLKGGNAVVSGKPQKANEALLKGKFGSGDEYERIKRAMEEAIASWKNKGQEEEALNVKAFHMYEEFRPSVQSGQGGWGRKGQLSPEKIRAVVAGG
ncbi:hypothetical protein AYL99_01723 [Fonsecaea erecta]|uniref:Uncharacterized protein n=1 Tax=Fonsecaea erecta TaxID=1367422 RepID=A0A179A2A2_9EURO|nr:hypothetical protein AYL99_01723 [Fonsecaea erecta]OAP65751.1 hypothetical protein AYL99_01723 [Fonsecaea erecta]